MEYLFIYCLHLCNIIDFLLFFAILGSVGFIVATIAYFVGTISYQYDEDENYGKEEKEIFKILKKITIVVTLVSILIALFPNKQTLLLMGGTYLGKKAAKEIVTSQKLEKVNTIIDLQLDKYIKELKTGL